MNKRTAGARGEDCAVAYLEKQKYKILERNYRSHFGEIDIIALDKSHTVFIEVKSRATSLFGSPHESIVKKKKRRITLTAIEYIQKKHLENKPLRFDVVAINPDSSIELIKNAFDAEYR
ncbi:MAG: YraN family protein [Deltaproteobacteria bacterium]|nr:YraN family protein [Deltaproteobacteria bacterium]